MPKTSQVGNSNNSTAHSRVNGLLVPQRRPRFTLIETLVVLAVISVLLALVVPRVGRAPAGLVFRTAVTRFRAAVRSAGLRARATGHAVHLRYDPQSRTLRIEDASPTEDSLLPQETAPSNEGDLAAGPAAVGAKKSDKSTSALYRDLTTWTLPRGVVCRSLAADGFGGDEEIVYEFSPNGELSGPSVELSVGRRRVRLIPDVLTGRLYVEKDR